MDGDYTGEDEANPPSQLDTDSARVTMELLQEGPGKESECRVPESNESHLVGTCGDGGGGEEAQGADLIVEERDAVDEVGDSRPGGGDMESEPANLLGVGDEIYSVSGDVAEDKKEVFNGEEPPSQVHGVGEGEVLTGGEQREQAQQVDGEGVTDGEGNQVAERKIGRTTASGKTEEATAMREETIAQYASLSDIVDERETPPDDKELASVAGFTEIFPQDKGLGDSVHESGSQGEQKEPSLEVHVGEGAKDVSDGEAREEVDINEDVLDGQRVQVAETETRARVGEEKKADTGEREIVAGLENQTKPQEAGVVAAEVAEQKEFPLDAHFAGETGDQQETAMVDSEEMVEKEAEAVKSEDIQVTEVPEEVETSAKDEVGVEEEGNGMAGVEEATEMVDVEEATEMVEEEGKLDEKKNTGAVEETEVRTRDEGQKGDRDMVDEAEHMETRDEKKDTGAVEETEERTGDEGQREDDDMVDETEDMETLGDSSVADRAEVRENPLEEMGMTESRETEEEAVMTDMGEEEPDEAEDVEEDNKTSGGKRKRVRNSKGSKGSGKKKEEDVCFICFDGGDLVLCDRRGCPKAYHPSCVGRDEAFFRSKDKWHCGWHLCSKCEKTATYLCYTCTFSLCKGCTKDAVFFCMRGKKGLCETCMETVKLIESKEQEKKEQAQLDFDDKSSWEYLFKDYWIDLKTQLSLSAEDLDQAKSPWKGHESRANKMESPNKINYATDGGSDSDGPPKKRKTRRQSKSGSAERMPSADDKILSRENVEWASKELLDVVMHMRHGDKSFVPRSEVHNLLLEYIKRYNLRDPRRKSQVICDSRLQNLFGKSHVGHFEMLNLLDSHFLIKEDSQADELQESVVDTEANHLDADENSDNLTKPGKDKRRKIRKKGDSRGRQSNLDDYAAIDMHNINLIYLRRNLVEDLLEDSTTFQEKVVGAFVRLRISGNQKQDLYRLVQVVGTSKAAEPYKVGKKTTGFVLEILNLDKTEVISIDIISNQDFTEDECKRLRQSIKCGLINRLTVGDIQEKAIVLQEVRVKNLLEAEIVRFSHLRDRASDMGRRKELRECVEKLQVLKSPEERQRRLEELPEIHADPSMDPSCESEDEGEKEEKEKDNYLRSRSSSFNRRGREPISPRRGGFSSSDSWSGMRNSASANRELTRNLSGRGFSSRGEHSGSDDRMNESLWSSDRDREMQKSVNSERPRSVSISEAGARSSRPVATHELSPRVVSEIPPVPPSAAASQPVPQINELEKMWHYKDPSGKVQGPFSMVQLRKWNKSGYFPPDLKIWKTTETQEDSILLTDALAGRFEKQTQLVDNSFTKAQPAVYSGRSPDPLGHSAGEGWKSEPEPGSTGTAAPSTLEIPKKSQDAWSSGTNLPSPTPNRATNPTPARKRNFESRWSPTPAQPSMESTVQLTNSSTPQSGLSPAPKPDIPMLLSPAGAPQIQTQMTIPSESQRSQTSPHPLPTPNSTNVSVNHLGSALTLPSPTPGGGKQGWGSSQAQKFDAGSSSQILSHGRRGDAPSSQNSSQFSSTGTPSAFPAQGQSGFPPSDSWRAPVQSHSNTQAPATPNLPWSMNMSTIQSTAQPQAPANQNSGWGQVAVNPNMGWVGPIQAGTNISWGSSVPAPPQGGANSGWVGPSQGQAQLYPNPGWGMTGQAQAQGQAPGNAGSGWMQPGQGLQSGNGNPNWAPHNQASFHSGSAPSGSHQSAFWGNQQNHNGDRFSNQRDGDSGYGWNRQSSSSSTGPNFKGQRICKFYRENGYCKKGASCDYIHN